MSYSLKEAFSNWRTAIYFKHKSINDWSENEKAEYNEIQHFGESKLKKVQIIKAEDILKTFRLRHIFSAWIDVINYENLLARKTSSFRTKLIEKLKKNSV